jgi:hypothetical protein
MPTPFTTVRSRHIVCPMADADSRRIDLLLTPAQMESDLEQLVAVLGRTWAYAQDKRENFGVDLDSLLGRDPDLAAALREARADPVA